MSSEEIVRSACGECMFACGVLVHLKDGKPVKVEGDPETPTCRGILCSKGLSSLEVLYHPDRLKYPLKRVGERGEGKWQRVTWDEALETVAKAMNDAKEKYGAESVAFEFGVAKSRVETYFQRLAFAFGTPNYCNTGHVCYTPKYSGSVLTCGFYPMPDFTPYYQHPIASMVIWAESLYDTHIAEYAQLISALDHGMKLVVINPQKIDVVSRADMWLKPRPGSDLALALGMINVIINEGLYDKEFVANWTVGFDELKAHVQDYPPEKVAEITWVPAEQIKEAARLYATNKPSCIELGNGIEHNVNSVQTSRAVAILRAITGNLDVPGGDIPWPPTLRAVGGFEPPELTLRDKLPEEVFNNRISAPLKVMPTYEHIHPHTLVKAILYGDPYPIKVLLIQGCNPLVTYSNAQEAYKAFKKLGFLSVADKFMTPTAALADIVLPVAGYLEFDNVESCTDFPTYVQVQQKVIQIGECWSDYKIVRELAKKLGLGKLFWDNEEQFFDVLLKPAGLTFKEFKKIGMIPGVKRYRNYERDGFDTPSGKVELYSSQLKEWGFDPLPVYHEQPETLYSDPELAREYPLILTTWKAQQYRHSEGRQIASLRGNHPDPTIKINPETAGKLGIKDGDWVYIETKRGRIKQKAALEDSLDQRVVIADYGWWFPEKGTSELYGWAESNVNILTDDKPPYSPEIGSTNLRGFLCKVYKVS